MPGIWRRSVASVCAESKIGALFAVLAGVLWLWIDADRRFDPDAR